MNITSEQITESNSVNEVTQNVVTEKDISTDSSVQPQKVELTPEEQMDFAMKIATEQQKALYTTAKGTLRALLNMLTAPNVNEAKRLRVKQAIETAFIIGLDHGVNVAKQPMTEKGIYAKYEGYFATLIAKIRDNGMIIIAHNYKKEEEKPNKSYIKGGELNGKNDDSGQGNESETLNQSETSI